MESSIKTNCKNLLTTSSNAIQDRKARADRADRMVKVRELAGYGVVRGGLPEEVVKMRVVTVPNGHVDLIESDGL
jgi:hypothetical protein